MKTKQIDSQKAIITVTSYKNTGKYYVQHTCELKEEHEKMQGYELMSLFKTNHPSVRDYTGLSCGVKGFLFVIDVVYLPKENRSNFCNCLVFGDGWDQ